LHQLENVAGLELQAVPTSLHDGFDDAALLVAFVRGLQGASEPHRIAAPNKRAQETYIIDPDDGAQQQRL